MALTLEELKSFYNGKKVLVTGHTGFKGSWLVRILTLAGAQGTGYALKNASYKAAGKTGSAQYDSSDNGSSAPCVR